MLVLILVFRRERVTLVTTNDGVVLLRDLSSNATQFININAIKRLTILQGLRGFLRVTNRFLLLSVGNSRTLGAQDVGRVTPFQRFRRLTRNNNVRATIVHLTSFNNTLSNVQGRLISRN